MTLIGMKIMNKKVISIILFFLVLLFVTLQLAAIRNPLFLMGDDSIYHISLINEIRGGQLDLGGYPPLMHMIIASIAILFNLNSITALTVTTVLIFSTLPLSYYVLVKHVTHDDRIGLLTGIATLLFSGVPALIYHFGGYPLLWGLAALPWVLLLFLRLYDKPNIGRLGLSALSLLILFFLHSPEYITCGLFIGAFLIQSFIGERNKFIRFLPWALLLSAGTVATLLALGLLNERLTPESINTISKEIVDNQISFGAFLKAVFFEIFVNNVNLLFLVFLLIGMARTMRYPKKAEFFLPLIVGIFLLIIYDATTTRLLSLFYAVTFPWSQETRLLFSLELPLCFLMVYGATFVWDKVRSKIARGIEGMIPLSIIMFTLTLTPLIINQAQLFSLSDDFRGGEKDIAAFMWIRDKTDEAAIILNDAKFYNTTSYCKYRPADVGGWIPVYTKQNVVITYPEGNNCEEVKTLFEKLAASPSEDETRQLLTNIDYIYYGSKRVYDRKRSLDIYSLFDNKSLMLVYSSTPETGIIDGEVYLFKVIKKQSDEMADF